MVCWYGTGRLTHFLIHLRYFLLRLNVYVQHFDWLQIFQERASSALCPVVTKAGKTIFADLPINQLDSHGVHSLIDSFRRVRTGEKTILRKGQSKILNIFVSCVRGNPPFPVVYMSKNNMSNNSPAFSRFLPQKQACVLIWSGHPSPELLDGALWIFPRQMHVSFQKLCNCTQENINNRR